MWLLSHFSLEPRERFFKPRAILLPLHSHGGRGSSLLGSHALVAPWLALRGPHPPSHCEHAFRNVPHEKRTSSKTRGRPGHLFQELSTFFLGAESRLLSIQPSALASLHLHYHRQEMETLIYAPHHVKSAGCLFLFFLHSSCHTHP